MQSDLAITWYGTQAILTIYWLFIFRVRKQKNASPPDVYPGVSIIVAVKNDAVEMQKNYQGMIRQDYPSYEIIIVDDHSDPNQQLLLQEMFTGRANVQLIRNAGTPGKKHALSLGIQAAKHPLILCTDADCESISDQWIRLMVNAGQGNAIVLGYSPYMFIASRLNQFIRFETVMTGIQYLSWAMLNRPYMGVGRNMLYPKSVFEKTDPYSSSPVPYGDDDLFIQAAKSHIRVNVCMHPYSFMYSEPARTLGEWIKQKHRHLSAAHHYSSLSWLQPGIYGMAVILNWLLFLPMLFTITPTWTIVFFAGILIRWFAYGFWTNKLGSQDTKWFYPWYEMSYAIYLASMGLAALFMKKKTWN